MLDEEYFLNRADLKIKGLEWGEEGEQDSLTKDQFKSLMRIELRKYVPAVYFSYIFTLVNCSLTFKS
jgi:hypothetical protein